MCIFVAEQNTIPTDKELVAEKSETFRFLQDFVSRSAKNDGNAVSKGTARAKAASASNKPNSINAVIFFKIQGCNVLFPLQ